MKPIVQSRKLHKVRYDVRGPILVEAQRLEAEGHKILKLNIGNTAPFGFEAPEAIVADMVHNLPDAQGYSDSRGIYSARTAVAQYYQSRGLRDTKNEDVFIGNGVSELISMVLTAFIDEGNEILVPAPDYPLWTGAVTLAGGTPVHYKCDESNGWNPDLEDIERKLALWKKEDAAAKRLMAIPGVGLLTATAAVATIGDAKVFKNGRQFAAFLGLVPRQAGTGGKVRLFGISKRGDTYLRKLLIHGARSVITHQKARAPWL